MKQTYHSNSTTNVRLRTEINKSNFPYSVLASQFGVSKNTIQKWKNRKVFEDKTSRPNTIRYALSEIETQIAIQLRFMTWWALDEIAEAVNPIAPEK